ncbi:NADPH-dependent ferric siderophore reductase, contains FAD-binding and SIP domains [Arthrobacter sp. cf158]|uniref:siderophore-interacting protein n=1 Tax=Arthrobacter sp. cf158 TaxID=1761744 RepID=UPI00089CAB1B|nr:siderophore-interacting protein [Arthrobacter sp. cf158]SDX35314.1 NADPH-dependent ferric siderophore reductase, contains FAD-binding and SIP domains [Arthrobacter sp. cf158]
MMSIYRAEVISTRLLTPGMVRITFGGSGLAGFDTTGVGDEYLRVFLPDPGTHEARLPISTGDSWDWSEGVEPSAMRTYTVRAVDSAAGTVDIDFVVHDGGLAASWAQRAQVGDVVGLNSPTGLYEPPAGLQWQILLADATGLPAVARLVEQTPPGVRTRVLIEVEDPSHQQELALGAGTEVAWIYGGNGHSQSRLDEVLRSMELPGGVGYIWVAGETKVLRGIRKYLRHEKKLTPESYKLIGYWTDKSEAWEERWENLDAETRRWFDDLWSNEKRDREEIVDLQDAKFELLGL